ncbi:DUF3545 family protein [Psychromonas aquimarina]|uniref:DUF3545 family protein n=1 Tax=Psychromonas aquimarina TaxID=444919 RepID=UPI000421EECD|nr:DUF3545 family protein [Psychromonas aquimarina]
MQYKNTDTDIQFITDEALFFIPKKRTAKARKWREIEAVKARQKLSRELRDIDQEFDYCRNDLV